MRAAVHRDILQLSVLIVIAIAAFFLTHAVAASNRETALRDAAEWYRRGQQALAGGQIDAAIDDFRRATVRDRGQTGYVRALAHALALHHDDEAARAVLLSLREAAPDDAELNVDLARLAARRQDVAEASRFYHNALYAPWPAEGTDERRGVRFELIQFLLAHGQPRRAQAELLAVSSDLPDMAATHLKVAALFEEAGDDAHALEHFQRALQLAPGDSTALAGAGLSAFRLRQYSAARTYLGRVPDPSGDVAATRDVVERVLAGDPLAPRIGSAERRRRLTSSLVYVEGRLSECMNRDSDGSITALQHDVEEFSQQLRRSGVLEQDTIEAGVDLIHRTAARLSQACGPATPDDRALVLIGRMRDGDSK
jgi:tetratricopeptide (TPR) repeat protein